MVFGKVYFNVTVITKNKYGGLVQEIPNFSNSPAGKSWTDFNRYRAEASSSTTSTSPTTPTDTNELNLYINAQFIDIQRAKLDLLNWWKTHQTQFHILSIFARDVLTVPVSSVSSEAAFSTAGRIMDDRRARLRPKLVKILTCVKDWERAKLKMPSELSQDHEDFVEAFNDWGLNE